MTNDAIADFRVANETALFDSGHPYHAAKTAELTALYQAKFSTPENQVTQTAAPESTGLGPQSSQLEKTVDMDGTDVFNDASPVSPATSPEAYQFSPESWPEEVKTDTGAAPLEYSPEFNTEVRGWLHSNEVTPAEGRFLEHVYREEIGHGFTDSRNQQLSELTRWELVNKYGERWTEALAAARKVATEGGDNMLDFLASTNLGSHPRVVAQFIKRAEKKGYFAP